MSKLTPVQVLKKITGSRIELVCPTDAMGCMEEYAKQQTAELKSQVNEMRDLLKEVIDVVDNRHMIDLERRINEYLNRVTK